ncbi:uncharacterized protein PHALS_05124 [Plasmopara halstedii]|uniref:Uncharacterized protein n=1 Tax=Plasmopara halstedii TaxID=4781 RepID=A0A0P1B1E7_PLAHL|nr:uncharacterized protein PHALS_05124 [Plasmopara halstedii]CEG47788.1 hypothetical protein PHALS_05124 [Plasmopara halstedii]|eukprot:XP_024584157.1 hypothetical protein PHALS_05124 [Plasmopara halstedii]
MFVCVGHPVRAIQSNLDKSLVLRQNLAELIPERQDKDRSLLLKALGGSPHH